MKILSVFNVPLLDFLYSVFFLLPGFLSYKTAAYYSRSLRESKDKFDKTFWSLISSGISISILYILLLLVPSFFRIGWLETLTRIVLTPEGTIAITENSLAIGYLLLIIISIIVGFLGALLYDLREQNRAHGIPDKQAAWVSFLNHAVREPFPGLKSKRVRLRVRLEDGKEIAGLRAYAGDRERDLVLSQPHLIEFNRDNIRSSNSQQSTTNHPLSDEKHYGTQYRSWDQLPKKKMGRYMYIPEDEIRFIVLESKMEIPDTLIDIIHSKTKSLLLWLSNISQSNDHLNRKELISVVEENYPITTSELSRKLSTSQSTINNHLIDISTDTTSRLKLKEVTCGSKRVCIWYVEGNE